MKISKKEISRLFLFFIPSILVGFSDKYRFLIYISFILTAGHDFFLYTKNNNNKKHLVNIVLYSLILPDNYIALVCITICVLMAGINVAKLTKWETGLIGWSLLRALFSLNHPLNVLVSILYWSAFIFCLLGRDSLLKNIDIEEITRQIKIIIIIEFAPVIIKAVFQKGFSNPDLDWVHGTLGLKQGVQLFMLMASFSIFLVFRYVFYKKRTDLIWGILAGSLAILTGTVALTLLLIGALLVYLVIYADIKKKILGLVGIVFVIVLLIASNHSWVYVDIMRLRDISYFINRVQKLRVYSFVFTEMPQENYVFSFIGQGVGRFSSRAAATLTGEYLSSFKLIDMSKYTESLILPMYKHSLMNNLGSTYLPFSEICTIAGELGFIGLFLFVGAFFHRYRKSNNYQKMYMLIVFVFLFYDNYFEFPRTAIVFFLIYYAICSKKRLMISERSKIFLYSSRLLSKTEKVCEAIRCYSLEEQH